MTIHSGQQFIQYITPPLNNTTHHPSTQQYYTPPCPNTPSLHLSACTSSRSAAKPVVVQCDSKWKKGEIALLYFTLPQKICKLNFPWTNLVYYVISVFVPCNFRNVIVGTSYSAVS